MDSIKNLTAGDQGKRDTAWVGDKIEALIVGARAGQDNSERFLAIGEELANLHGQDLEKALRQVVELGGAEGSAFYCPPEPKTTGGLDEARKRIKRINSAGEHKGGVPELQALEVAMKKEPLQGVAKSYARYLLMALSDSPEAAPSAVSNFQKRILEQRSAYENKYERGVEHMALYAKTAVVKSLQHAGADAEQIGMAVEVMSNAKQRVENKPRRKR